ncbi:hypothetical protein AUEXF2481DRAFT_209426 [Aureobasidium subglaciale EXF-2481]|uniref:Uncharacterized protein n=1 Tax=Aureobasidium subglaciale (strain EXF-2481) TaxID=1043005 RepID=A0A074YV42_AURSE|nr:uncharacterized protein AUEXF2481DRAFT_209426 [Aureobasidium subglaciale EXF-2481]KAI5211372.1 hypothetical protein E4T38_01307 [Aureobasidium subglaciale]KAI5229656.1 hypothetical protein E4T40_01308 [Aureobasidium subglaciale]KAI5233427.1 hypothetical protein E4T41_01306 [Aureobasidium subglaciale]KAI5266635.1 hypothetical protein E4T46_01307 [Aureobasidium subglaciale]KER00030.1 hypothetical protein AUEXF2481DRAFT_209426 [Aureobasidium subglaciale EXF-2481]
MHATSLIISTSLALALTPAGVLGWAQAANGVWVASNTWYGRVGNYNNVHESCTRMNSQTVLTSGECAYWTDGNGNMGHGNCYAHDDKVGCESCNEDGRAKCLVGCQITCAFVGGASSVASCINRCRGLCRDQNFCTDG